MKRMTKRWWASAVLTGAVAIWATAGWADEPVWETVEPATEARLEELFDRKVPGLERPADRPVQVIQTELTPATILHTRLDGVRLLGGLREMGLSGPTRVAYPTAEGVKVAGRGAVDARLSESWLLVWFTGGEGWQNILRASYIQRFMKDDKRYALDMPMLISLQRRPTRIEVSADGVELAFPGEGGVIAIHPLRGVDLLDPDQTAGWADGLPEPVLDDARRMNRLLKAIPVQAYERYHVNAQTGWIAINYRYRFATVSDDWATEPLKAAPVPPAVALAVRGGMPLRIPDQRIDLRAPSYLGPNWVVPGAEEFTLAVPDLLELVTKVSVPDIAPSDRTGAGDDAELLARIDAGLPGKTWDTGVGWWAGAAVATKQAEKARYLPYVTEPTRRKIKAATMRLMNQMLFDGTDMVHPIIDEQRGRVYVVDYLNHFKRYQGDNEAPASEILRGCWDYAFYTGDWASIRANWKMLQGAAVASYVKNNWVMQARPNSGGDTFHDVLVGTAAMARMAAVLGEREDYGLFTYLLARHLINYYGFEYAALPFAREHRPWVVPLSDSHMVVWDIYEPFGPFFAPWDAGGYYGGHTGFFEHYFRMDRDVMPRFYKQFLPEHTREFFGKTVPENMPPLEAKEKSKLSTLFALEADFVDRSRGELEAWLEESSWKGQKDRLASLVRLYDASNPRKLVEIVAPSLREAVTGRGIELQARGTHQNLLGLDTRTARAPGLYLFGFNAPKPEVKPKVHGGYVLPLGRIEPLNGRVVRAEDHRPNWVTRAFGYDVVVPTADQRDAYRRQGQAAFMVAGPFGDQRLTQQEANRDQQWAKTYPPEQQRVPDFSRTYRAARKYEGEEDTKGEIAPARWQLRQAGNDKAHDGRGLPSFAVDTRIKGAGFGYTYVFTQVYSPRAREVRMGLSTAGPARVWVNGRKVFEKERDKTVELDRNVFSVQLCQGWNTVLWRERVDDFWSRSFFRVMDENDLAIPEVRIDPRGRRTGRR